MLTEYIKFKRKFVLNFHSFSFGSAEGGKNDRKMATPLTTFLVANLRLYSAKRNHKLYKIAYIIQRLTCYYKTAICIYAISIPYYEL